MTVKNLLRVCRVFICIFFCGHLAAQTRKIDSLLKATQTVKEDSNLSKTYYRLAVAQAAAQNYTAAVIHSGKARGLAFSQKQKKLYTNCLLYESQLYLQGLAMPDTAIQRLNTLKRFAAKEKDYRNEIIACLVMSDAYNELAAYAKAMEYGYEALRKSERNLYTEGTAHAHKAIGVAHAYLSDYFTSVKEYEMAKEIYLSLGDTTQADGMLYVLGIAHGQLSTKTKGAESKKHLALAIEQLARLRKICEESRNENDLHLVNNELAGFYAQSGQCEKALECVLSSYRYFKKNSQKEPAANSCVKIITYLECLKRYGEKLPFLNDLYFSAVELKNPVMLMGYMTAQAQYLEETGDYKTACGVHKRCTELRDSVFNSKFTAQAAEMSKKYESEKKDKELLKKDAEIKIEQAASRQKSTQRNVFIGGFGVMVLMTFLVFRSYNQKKKANLIISLQKKEVEDQKRLVEEKQKEVLDSIHYAKRIQRSLITSEKYISRAIDRLKK
jgi:tetratricopeptide (TPR) repeat protein